MKRFILGTLALFIIAGLITSELGIRFIKFSSQSKTLLENIPSQTGQEIEAKDFKNFDSRPFSGRTLKVAQRRGVKRPQVKFRKSAKLYNLKMDDFVKKPKKHSFKHGKDKKKKSKKNAKNKKKKKKDDKKKNAKKDKDKKDQQVANEELEDIEAEEAITEVEPEPTPEFTTAGPLVPLPNPAGDNGFQSNKTQLGFDEWAEMVLAAPHYENTIYMINQFKTNTGKIDSETFYKIVAEMLVDDRAKIQEYGVMAARNTPSQKSFEALSFAMENNKNGSAVRVLAEKSIDQVYQNINQLNVLKSVLASSLSTFAVTKALQVVSAAASKILTNPLPGDDENGTLSTQINGSHPYAERFQELTDLLAELAQAENKQVKSAATTTQSDLNQILSS